MNLLLLNIESLKQINQIPNFSQLAILFEDLDNIPKQEKINTLSTIIEKIRKDGELVLKIIDYSKIIDKLCKNDIDIELGLSLLQRIKFHTEPMEIINFIVSLEPRIVLYKMIEEDHQMILTLKRLDY